MTEINVCGAVQGVGFRPTVYAAARDLNIAGTVVNSRAGVTISINGSENEAQRLLVETKKRLPAPARIDSVSINRIDDSKPFTDFTILPSLDQGELPTDVSPDIAICSECLADIKAPGRRHNYPLTNCTHCGPRFSIVTALPYDRVSTTMSRFSMCPECKSEYDNPLDRRHHAQPTACHVCGPSMWMITSSGERIDDYDMLVARTKEELINGRLIICKSLGGYNIIADATSDKAVMSLRLIKHRPRKPFAIMAADISAASEIAYISTEEADAMSSWRAPIVIVKAKPNILSEATAPECSTIGIMLPYMALHHSLCSDKAFLVITSANLPGQPIMTDDNEAVEYAKSNGLSVIIYNREIANRLDDSLVRIVDGHQRLMRRSRGFAPEPLHTSSDCGYIFATGADITSQWAMGRGNDIIQSPYIGSLREEGCEASFRESFRRLSSLYHFTPDVVVTDMHPAYTSRRLAEEIASEYNAVILEMQHHHAHAVSVMADQQIYDDVLALVLDGTGYGQDNTIWGAELLKCDRTSFSRLSHGKPLPMPGGDMASLEPWRMAASWVWSATGSLELLPHDLVSAIGSDKVRIIGQMLDKNINCPLSSGAGRIFDAVAALLGLAYTNGYESEAPILLEGCAATSDDNRLYSISPDDPHDMSPMLFDILKDIRDEIDRSVIASRFHATYAEIWSKEIIRMSNSSAIKQIVMSGGVMQNARLTSQLRLRLMNAGIEMILPESVCLGDACIAVGQVAYAAQIRKSQKYA